MASAPNDGGTVVTRLRLRTGQELDVLDLSERGARVEGDTRLLPGSEIEVHLETSNGRIPVRTRVLRSHVCALTAGAVRYQSLLIFESIPRLAG